MREFDDTVARSMPAYNCYQIEMLS